MRSNINYSELSFFFTPFINYDNEDNLELHLSSLNESQNSTQKSTIKSKKSNRDENFVENQKSILMVIYDLIFNIFNKESHKDSLYISININRENINHKNCINYICSSLLYKKYDNINNLIKKLNKRFILFDTSINSFLANFNNEFTPFFNATNFNKNKLIENNQISFKKNVVKKTTNIIYKYSLGLFNLLFYFNYINNDQCIKLSGIKVAFDEKNEYKKFLFDKYINEYFLKGYDVRQMIISFMIQKEKIFNLVDYNYNENIKKGPKFESKNTKINTFIYDSYSEILIEEYLFLEENNHIHESNLLKNLKKFWEDAYDL